MDRVAAEEKQIRRIGKRVYAYRPVAEADYSDVASQTVRELARFGIQSFVYEGTLEANDGRMTASARGQASTLPDGSVGLNNRVTFAPKIVAGHEMYHVAGRRGMEQAARFRDTIGAQLDFQNAETLRYLDFIAQSYFGDGYDLSQNADGIMEEFAAAVSGDLNDPSRGIEGLFQNEAGVFRAWEELRDAMLDHGGENGGAGLGGW